MPHAASELEAEEFLRVLAMGPPKVGKSTCTITSLAEAFGLGYVINCDLSDSSLNGAQRRTKKFEFDRVSSWDQMEKAMKAARENIAVGKYKWVALDTLSSFSTQLVQQCLDQTDKGSGPDGRRAYPDYERRLRHVIEFFMKQKAHFVAVSHYLDVAGQEIEGQLEKTGEGIVPLLAGKARATIPMLFHDILWMELRKSDASPSTGGRVFVTGPQGVWGPGCRSLEGVRVMPADFGEFIKAVREEQSNAGKGNNNNSHAKPTTVSKPHRPSINNR